ncbi:peptidyl-prolyl cis-trans isomerase FKBP8-like [Saccoglossus kowalevskii]|uniref:peptidylprolyl isomerase n=1 Tax=Saccoglossus kowalevskii TaxID=10224 RepID=A0ABM0M285_SACKO|nr:PREDICTED: peptidyl-prolyl cis-trans isomerase FKBP8-like [Saccoglossus kowalevskii]
MESVEHVGSGDDHAGTDGSKDSLDNTKRTETMGDNEDENSAELDVATDTMTMDAMTTETMTTDAGGGDTKNDAREDDTAVNEVSVEKKKMDGSGDAPKPTVNSTESNEDTKESDPEEVEKKKWMDILGNGQLKKKVLKPGGGYRSRPARGDFVTVKYKTYLENDNEVEDCESLKFILGDGDVIAAFDLAVAVMEMGEVCTLLSDSRFTYGDLGREPDIPGGAKLRFELELLAVDDVPDMFEIDATQRLSLGNKKRERGNELYFRNDYSNAINSYTRAINYLEPEEGMVNKDEFKKIEELKVKCYNNLAACQLKVEAYEAALKSCNAVLKVEPDNVKALFRKAKVLAQKGELEDAVIYMRKAIKLEPSNKTIHQELAKIVGKLSNEMKSTKDMCKKMVGDLADSATKLGTEKSATKSWFSTTGMLFGAAIVGIGAVVTTIILSMK